MHEGEHDEVGPNPSGPDPGPASDPAELEAAAVGYRRGRDPAPRLLAKGRGDAARRILEHADAQGIPIERDPDLLQSLALMDVGEEIPNEAFVAVAEILAFLYERNSTIHRA